MTGSRQANKQHKQRYSSKGKLNTHKGPKEKKLQVSDGRIKKGNRKVRAQISVNKRKKQGNEQKQKKAAVTSGPPRVIVLFGLSSAVDLNSLEDELLGVLSPSQRNGNEFLTVASTEFQLRASILKAPHGNLSACMEMAKVADLIAFVASASSNEESSDSYIDAFGSLCLSVFRAIGLPNTAVLIRSHRTDLKKDFTSQFPEDCKVYAKDELRKFTMDFKDQKVKTPLWRTEQPYLVAEKVDMVNEDCTSGKCTLLLTGYVRARSLSVNQLVHISGAGDFQLSQIELLKDPCPLIVNKRNSSMDSDDINNTQVIRCILPDPKKQEAVVVENIPDPLTAEQTWPTDAEMAEADRNHKDKKLKKRKHPPGTNEYMAAWIVDSDNDYSDTDDDSEHDDMELEGTENGFSGNDNVNDFEPDDDNITLPGGFDDKTDTDSVMMDGENLTKEQIKDEIRRIKEAHAEDEEFPDEVDTPVDVPARRRFAKYRGLKSFRTSFWDPKESLPADYGRIFAFDNFKRTQKHVLAKAEELEQGDSDECIRTGSYARLHIKDVPNFVASKLSELAKRAPVVLCGLLQHESKVSVLHFSIKKHDTYTAPLKAKEELTFHVGFRQFIARPLYSSDSINNDKSKMERFLHPGKFSVASIYAPICFHKQPLVAVKNSGELASPAVAGTGTLKCVDPDRIVLKRIILTGYPERVSKAKATVRFMFHNPEDVRWFKPVELWSKRGRRGRVKEPNGTHGAMKCFFNGIVQQHDTVCMSLYKRSYPKRPSQWFPLLNA